MRPVRPIIESLRTDRSIRMHHHIVDTCSTGGIPLRAHRLRISDGIGDVVIAWDKVQAVQVFCPVPEKLPPRFRRRLYSALHPVGDIPGTDDEVGLSEHSAPACPAVIRQYRIFQKAERPQHRPAHRVCRNTLRTAELPVYAVMQVGAVHKTENFPVLRPNTAAEQGNTH